MVSFEPAMRRCMSSENGGDHAVVVAIRDQCRLGDNGQVGRCGAPPTFGRFELGSEGLHCDWRVSILGAFFEALDECAPGALADVVAVEVQKLLGVPTGKGDAQHVVVGGSGNLVNAFSACRSGSGEDQLANEFRMSDHQCLGDHHVDKLAPPGIGSIAFQAAM